MQVNPHRYLIHELSKIPDAVSRRMQEWIAPYPLDKNSGDDQILLGEIGCIYICPPSLPCRE
jgi:hypothetical protein